MFVENSEREILLGLRSEHRSVLVLVPLVHLAVVEPRDQVLVYYRWPLVELVHQAVEQPRSLCIIDGH